MREPPSPDADRLFALPLLSGVGAQQREQIAAGIAFVRLAPAEPLFGIGTISEALYVVVEGAVALDLPPPRGDDWFRIETRTAGQTLGDFAFLNRSHHLVTASGCQEGALVARLSRTAFEALGAADDSVRPVVYDTAAELGRRVMLAHLFIELFEDLDCECMQDLLGAVTVQHHRGGDVVFEAGTPSDGLHFIVSGRLVTERVGAHGGRVFLRDFRGPDVVGVIGLLSDAERIASLIAARASVVAHLPREAFERIVLANGALVATLTRRLLQRLGPKVHRDAQGTGSGPVHPRTFAVFPIDDSIDINDEVASLLPSVSACGRSEALDAASFDAAFGVGGASDTAFSDLLDPSIGRWLEDRELANDALLYVGRQPLCAWGDRIANRADRIVLVASADADASSAAARVAEIRDRFGSARHSPPIELVLVHASTTERPRNTAAWLDAIAPTRLHHVRRQTPAHLDTLARRLTGKERGLVLSSGGARGYAHLGVQRLFEERGLAIDHVGGTSMGALLGAAMAMGHDHDAVSELSARFANRRALFDFTLPMVSVMRSRKLTRFCQSVCGEVNIEDLWTPFFAVSSNLADGRPVVHDRGPLWLAVRCSISLPGLFSPVPTDDGKLLVDGAVLNGFPVDVMRERLSGLGEVIGVNVSRVPEPINRFNFGSEVSGWSVLSATLSPFHDDVVAPRVIETLLRSTDVKDVERNAAQREAVDVLIEPDVSAWALLDFKRYRAISDVGYETARRVLDGETESVPASDMAGDLEPLALTHANGIADAMGDSLGGATAGPVTRV